jgi:hypothetical protein
VLSLPRSYLTGMERALREMVRAVEENHAINVLEAMRREREGMPVILASELPEPSTDEER